MTRILENKRQLLRIGVLAVAVIAAAVSFGGETKPVSASHTKIFFSHSNSVPVPASTIVLQPGASQEFYIWAAGIDDPTGVSGFQVEVTINDLLVRVDSFEATGETWLGVAVSWTRRPSTTLAP